MCIFYIRQPPPILWFNYYKHSENFLMCISILRSGLKMFPNVFLWKSHQQLESSISRIKVTISITTCNISSSFYLAAYGRSLDNALTCFAVSLMFSCLLPRALLSTAFSIAHLYWIFNITNKYSQFFPILNKISSKSSSNDSIDSNDSTSVYSLAIWVLVILFYMQSFMLLTYFYN